MRSNFFRRSTILHFVSSGDDLSNIFYIVYSNVFLIHKIVQKIKQNRIPPSLEKSWVRHWAVLYYSLHIICIRCWLVQDNSKKSHTVQCTYLNNKYYTIIIYSYVRFARRWGDVSIIKKTGHFVSGWKKKTAETHTRAYIYIYYNIYRTTSRGSRIVMKRLCCYILYNNFIQYLCYWKSPRSVGCRYIYIRNSDGPKFFLLRLHCIFIHHFNL